jgi:hypothetical protein
MYLILQCIATAKQWLWLLVEVSSAKEQIVFPDMEKGESYGD